MPGPRPPRQVWLGEEPDRREGRGCDLQSSHERSFRSGDAQRDRALRFREGHRRALIRPPRCSRRPGVRRPGSGQGRAGTAEFRGSARSVEISPDRLRYQRPRRTRDARGPDPQKSTLRPARPTVPRPRTAGLRESSSTYEPSRTPRRKPRTYSGTGLHASTRCTSPDARHATDHDEPSHDPGAPPATNATAHSHTTGITELRPSRPVATGPNADSGKLRRHEVHTFSIVPITHNSSLSRH